MLAGRKPDRERERERECVSVSQREPPVRLLRLFHQGAFRKLFGPRAFWETLSETLLGFRGGRGAKQSMAQLVFHGMMLSVPCVLVNQSFFCSQSWSLCTQWVYVIPGNALAL